MSSSNPGRLWATDKSDGETGRGGGMSLKAGDSVYRRGVGGQLSLAAGGAAGAGARAGNVMVTAGDAYSATALGLDADAVRGGDLTIRSGRGSAPHGATDGTLRLNSGTGTSLLSGNATLVSVGNNQTNLTVLSLHTEVVAGMGLRLAGGAQCGSRAKQRACDNSQEHGSEVRVHAGNGGLTGGNLILRAGAGLGTHDGIRGTGGRLVLKSGETRTGTTGTVLLATAPVSAPETKEDQDDLTSAKPGVKYGSGDIRVSSGQAEGPSALSGDLTLASGAAPKGKPGAVRVMAGDGLTLGGRVLVNAGSGATKGGAVALYSGNATAADGSGEKHAEALGGAMTLGSGAATQFSKGFGGALTLTSGAGSRKSGGMTLLTGEVFLHSSEKAKYAEAAAVAACRAAPGAPNMQASYCQAATGALTLGTGRATSSVLGRSGDVFIHTGDATGIDSTAGTVNISVGRSTGAGGDVVVCAGESGPAGLGGSVHVAGGSGGAGGSFIASAGRGQDGGSGGQVLLLNDEAEIGVRLNGSGTLVNGSRVILSARRSIDMLACSAKYADGGAPEDAPPDSCSGVRITEMGQVRVASRSGLNLTAGVQPPPSELRSSSVPPSVWPTSGEGGPSASSAGFRSWRPSSQDVNIAAGSPVDMPPSRFQGPGGAVVVTAGKGAQKGSGGDVIVESGESDAGTSGGVWIASAACKQSNVGTGNVTVATGDTLGNPPNTAAWSGALRLRSGDSSGRSGDVLVSAGAVVGTKGVAGSVHLSGGSAVAESVNGGRALLEGGAAFAGDTGDVMVRSPAATKKRYSSGWIKIGTGGDTEARTGGLNLTTGVSTQADAGPISIHAGTGASELGAAVNVSAGSTTIGRGGPLTIATGGGPKGSGAMALTTPAAPGSPGPRVTGDITLTTGSILGSHELAGNTRSGAIALATGHAFVETLAELPVGETVYAPCAALGNAMTPGKILAQHPPSRAGTSMSFEVEFDAIGVKERLQREALFTPRRRTGGGTPGPISLKVGRSNKEVGGRVEVIAGASSTNVGGDVVIASGFGSGSGPQDQTVKSVDELAAFAGSVQLRAGSTLRLQVNGTHVGAEVPLFNVAASDEARLAGRQRIVHQAGDARLLPGHEGTSLSYFFAENALPASPEELTKYNAAVSANKLKEYLEATGLGAAAAEFTAQGAASVLAVGGALTLRAEALAEGQDERPRPILIETGILGDAEKRRRLSGAINVRTGAARRGRSGDITMTTGGTTESHVRVGSKVEKRATAGLADPADGSGSLLLRTGNVSEGSTPGAIVIVGGNAVGRPGPPSNKEGFGVEEEAKPPTGGSLDLRGGDVTSTYGLGGDINVTSGSVAQGRGGRLHLRTGSSKACLFARDLPLYRTRCGSGDVALASGNALAGDSGEVRVQVGDAQSGRAGELVLMGGGTGEPASPGGRVITRGGAAPQHRGIGGDVHISSGSGGATGASGRLDFETAPAPEQGKSGAVRVATGDSAAGSQGTGSIVMETGYSGTSAVSLACACAGELHYSHLRPRPLLVTPFAPGDCPWRPNDPLPSCSLRGALRYAAGIRAQPPARAFPSAEEARRPEVAGA